MRCLCAAKQNVYMTAAYWVDKMVDNEVGEPDAPFGARVCRIFALLPRFSLCTEYFLRFGVVGAVNTVVYFGLYSALRQACSYLVSHLLAFLTAMAVSFFLNCSFTFRVRPTARKFVLFPLSNAAGFVLQTMGLFVLVDVLGMPPAYAPLPAMAAAVPVTFLVARSILSDGHRSMRGGQSSVAVAGR